MLLLVEVWLAPTARYSNRVTITEVLTRAIAARRQMIFTGSIENRESETYDSSRAPRPFNAVLHNVVFMTVFGIAANDPTQDAGMLQVCLAGAAPGIGECHFACPSDCFAWSARNRSFIIAQSVPDEDWVRECSRVVDEWNDHERGYTQGDHSAQAQWMSGGPLRAAVGGVGGNRWLLMAPEPITAELWRSVTGNLRNVKMARLSEVDRIGDARVPLAQRAKQPSAGGAMAIYSPKTGMRRSVSPLGAEGDSREQGVEPVIPEGAAGER